MTWNWFSARKSNDCAICLVFTRKKWEQYSPVWANQLNHEYLKRRFNVIYPAVAKHSWKILIHFLIFLLYLFFVVDPQSMPHVVFIVVWYANISDGFRPQTQLLIVFIEFYSFEKYMCKRCKIVLICVLCVGYYAWFVSLKKSCIVDKAQCQTCSMSVKSNWCSQITI